MVKWPWKVQESAHQTVLPWREALSIPLLTYLIEQEQSKLVAPAERFLQQKRLAPLQGFELNSSGSCQVALLFCLPALELGLGWLDGFHEVLIYPAPFVADDEQENDIGLVHNQRIIQSDQNWQRGPIVLNWLGIQDSFDASDFDLIIHEVTRELDTRNGSHTSEVPFTPLREVAGWEHDLYAIMNNIQEEIKSVGENAVSIDACTTSNPAEYFAVLSEYFLSALEFFAPHFPPLWQRFYQFYQQNPLQRLHHANDADSFSVTNVH